MSKYAVEVELVGHDGNAFAIMGKVQRALKQAGATPDELMANYQSSDPGAILVRAMYRMYPTPELRRYVEAYNAEGLY